MVVNSKFNTPKNEMIIKNKQIVQDSISSLSVQARSRQKREKTR